jgi:hypothetical protein
MRLDVMSVMRGVASFEELWRRRTTLELAGGATLELMSLPDLVQAKKTQRDKDWPMIRRLVEANHAQQRERPSPEQLAFWFRESRTPSMLIALAARHPDELARAAQERPLLARAAAADGQGLSTALAEEEARERELDRAYWRPLRQELELLRHRERG